MSKWFTKVWDNCYTYKIGKIIRKFTKEEINLIAKEIRDLWIN